MHMILFITMEFYQGMTKTRQKRLWYLTMYVFTLSRKS